MLASVGVTRTAAVQEFTAIGLSLREVLGLALARVPKPYWPGLYAEGKRHVAPGPLVPAGV